ncbi:MAG: Ig-like domain-containing domain [Crocinitomicaceae bacterium]
MNKFILIYIAFLLSACAQVGRLSGGPKDEAAPSINESKSNPLPGTTNFQGNQLEIAFDEYISISGIKQYVTINPPFEKGKEPDYKMKGKKLVVRFNDSLKPNTTYNFSFNRALKDITEKNDSLFQFAFSTGPYLDSMSAEGKVLDAYTNEPKENVTLLLFEEMEDSTPYKSTPIYFTQTDKNGKFKLKYIKEGEYMIFALKDQNRNNLYDLTTESFGFIEDPMRFNVDSVHQGGLLFRMSQITPDKMVLESYDHEFPGPLQLKFNKDVENLNLKTINNEPIQFSLDLKSEDDSLICWIPPVDQDTLALQIIVNDTILDTLTLSMRYLGKGSNAELRVPEFKLVPNAKPSLDYYDTLEITSTLPIGFVDSARIYVLDKDSNLVKGIHFKSNYRKITVYGNWEPKMQYRLVIPDSAVVSKYGYKNDSTQIIFNKQQSDYYGNLFLNLRVAEPSFYVLELLNTQNKVLRTVELDQSSRVKFELLAPGNYKFRLIKDANHNGKWDPGNYLKKIQPERVYYLQSPVNMRSNWDQEVDWEIIKE